MANRDLYALNGSYSFLSGVFFIESRVLAASVVFGSLPRLSRLSTCPTGQQAPQMGWRFINQEALLS